MPRKDSSDERIYREWMPYLISSIYRIWHDRIPLQRFTIVSLFSRTTTTFTLDFGIFNDRRYPLPEVNAMTESITVNINGTPYTHDVEPRLLLIHYLREVVGLTGPHIGCETSLCGACTVEFNGKAVKSCAMFAIQADGAKILTIEGLAVDGKMHKMQEAFWNEHGLQCGFCTPGMIMTSKQLLERNPNPSEQEIRHGLEGNLCRCTGYQHIVNAVKAAAKVAGA